MAGRSIAFSVGPIGLRVRPARVIPHSEQTLHAAYGPPNHTADHRPYRASNIGAHGSPVRHTPRNPLGLRWG